MTTGHKLGIAEVVSGTVEFTSGHETHRVGPGRLVTTPIGTPHTFNNPDGDRSTEPLFTSAPGPV